MTQFIFRRLVQSITTFFGITILSYLLKLGAPGGPVVALTFGPRITPQEREAYAARLGVNDPVFIQYLRWLLGDDWMRWDGDGDGVADHNFLLPLDADGDNVAEEPGTRRGILRGDFGLSFFQRRPVLDVIVERIPATLELGFTALILSIVIGVPVGIWAAIRRGGLFDNLTRVVAVIFNAIPGFWLGLILILIFGSNLGLLPMGNRCGAALSGGCPPIYQRLNYLLLPTLVLAAAPIASYSRFMRASMLETISKDYIRTAQAKGLSSRVVWFRHGARNALIPLATFLGPAITGLLGGAAVVETIFSWPGLGRLAVTSVVQQDYPIVMATVILTAAATLLGLLLSDILYVYIDPRIRFS
jgi:peptide/nickel transport system permease protein